MDEYSTVHVHTQCATTCTDSEKKGTGDARDIIARIYMGAGAGGRGQGRGLSG